VDIERLKKIMVSQDINIDDERFVRAFRIFENPAGCEHCGARTKVGIVVPAKGKTPSHVKLACCGRKDS
jgi:hypothetical protein